MNVPYSRHNARLSSPVELEATFYSGGVAYDPVSIVSVSIWKFGDSVANGGILVDVVDGSHVIQDSTGHFRIIWDPYLQKTSPGDPGSPLTSPGVQGPGSPAQGVSPLDPTDITANARYYDVWNYIPSHGYPEQNSVGLTFYIYPDSYFVSDNFEKYRFEAKLDRKQLVRGENLDLRIQIIPIPLYRALREPIISYILPISTMRIRIVNTNNDLVIDWTAIQFTGKEGIVPTSLLSGSALGAYYIQSELTLPNGQFLRFPKQALSLID